DVVMVQADRAAQRASELKGAGAAHDDPRMVAAGEELAEWLLEAWRICECSGSETQRCEDVRAGVQTIVESAQGGRVPVISPSTGPALSCRPPVSVPRNDRRPRPSPIGSLIEPRPRPAAGRPLQAPKWRPVSCSALLGGGPSVPPEPEG